MAREMLSSMSNTRRKLGDDSSARTCRTALHFVVDRAKDRTKIGVRVRRVLSGSVVRFRRSPRLRRRRTLGLNIVSTRRTNRRRSDRAGRTRKLTLRGYSRRCRAL
jgi:hypothetical protein